MSRTISGRPRGSTRVRSHGVEPRRELPGVNAPTGPPHWSAPGQELPPPEAFRCLHTGRPALSREGRLAIRAALNCTNTVVETRGRNPRPNRRRIPRPLTLRRIRAGHEHRRRSSSPSGSVAQRVRPSGAPRGGTEIRGSSRPSDSGENGPGGQPPRRRTRRDLRNSEVCYPFPHRSGYDTSTREHRARVTVGQRPPRQPRSAHEHIGEQRLRVQPPSGRP